MLLVGIDAGRHLVDGRLVDHELAVVADSNLESIHRPRRRAFEVESRDVVARAVTRTLELLFGLEPARSTSEMRALGKDRIEAGFGPHDPGAEVLLELLTHFADDVVVGKPRLELGRR